MFQSLFQILDDVIDVFNADRQTDHARDGCRQPPAAHRSARRWVELAGRTAPGCADIGNMNHQRSQLQAVDKAHSRLPAACQREGDDAAASVRQILRCQLTIWILCQRRVVDRFQPCRAAAKSERPARHSDSGAPSAGAAFPAHDRAKRQPAQKGNSPRSRISCTRALVI